MKNSSCNFDIKWFRVSVWRWMKNAFRNILWGWLLYLICWPSNIANIMSYWFQWYNLFFSSFQVFVLVQLLLRWTWSWSFDLNCSDLNCFNLNRCSQIFREGEAWIRPSRVLSQEGVQGLFKNNSYIYWVTFFLYFLLLNCIALKPLLLLSVLCFEKIIWRLLLKSSE